jgi:hypothetical protein
MIDSPMKFSGRFKSIAFFVILAICLIAAVTLNVGWIVLHWRQGVLVFLGFLGFLAIIIGDSAATRRGSAAATAVLPTHAR